MSTPLSLRRRIKGWMHSMPGMIGCEEFETFILDYLEGDLPAPKRRVFERHLRMCRECRDYLAAYEASLDLARQAVRQDDDRTDLSEVPEDLVAAVIAAQKAK